MIRASFDSTILLRGDIRNKIEDALTQLVSTILDANVEETLRRISTSLFETISSPVLRHQLITSLPYSTPRTHLFRRRLALAFALNSFKRLSSDMTNPALTHHIILCLQKSSTYTISPTTDYTKLRAALNMLDIGIDVGFSDFSFLHKSSPTEKPSASLTDGRVVKEVNEEERKFNTDVDFIVKELREIMARVVDTGATHMRRTEAKGALERLVQRLEYSVRTKPKAARDWFRDGREGTENKALMESWVGKALDVKGVEVKEAGE